MKFESKKKFCKFVAKEGRQKKISKTEEAGEKNG